MRRYLWALVAFLVVFGAGVFIAQHRIQKPSVSLAASASPVPNPVDPGAPLGGRPAPDFTLTDQFGHAVSLSQFHGKVVVLAFVDPECLNICPLTTQSMLRAVALLGPRAARHIQLVGVDANPTATSVADVRAFSEAHGLEHRWVFLTGNRNQLAAVWKKYYVYVGIVNGQIDHTPALYVINSQGREERVFMTSSRYNIVGPEASTLAATVARYLPKGTVSHFTPIAYRASSVTPYTAQRLPKVSRTGIDGTVVIGPGRPKLVVFFATWVPDAANQLQDLNALVAGVPGIDVVGVDVMSTEPSKSAVLKFIANEPALRFPVALDVRGNLAQAYGIQDLAWLSLTDAQGKIIWSHDSWLSESALVHDIHQALAKSTT